MNKKVIISSNIFTSKSKELFNGAIVINDDKIVAVVNKDEYSDYVDDNTEVLDYKDNLIIPGLIEAHMHYLNTALVMDNAIFMSSYLDSEEKIVKELKNSEYYENKKEGEWLFSMGWYLPIWADKTLPTKKSLDEAFPNNPVIMVSGDGHAAWLNSQAMKALKLDKNSIVPEGGSFEYDENRELTGVFHEAAAFILTAEIQDMLDTDKLYNRYLKVQDYFIKNGVTAISDMSMMPADSDHSGIREDIFVEMRDNNELSLRVSMYPELTKTKYRFNKIKDFKSSDRLRLGGAKQFFDGVSGTHTAWQTKPYTHPLFEGDRGKATIDPKVMEEIIMYAHKNNIQIRTHCIGDASVHSALDSIEKAQDTYGPKPELKHTLEHVESILEEDIDRLKKLNVLVSAQPAHALIDPEGIEYDLGKERSNLMWIFKTYIEKGIDLAFGTDSPVVYPNALETLYYAVTRQNLNFEPKGGWYPNQKISIEDALVCSTLGGAKALAMQDKIGSIEKGKYADIVALDKNILSLEAKEILNTKILFTMINGEIVYKI